MKGVGFFLGGLLLEALGLPRRAVADGRRCSALILAGVACCRCRASWARPRPRRSFKELFAKIPRHQPAGGGAHLPVRRARCLVRGRPAGVPLRQGWSFIEVGGFLAAWTIGYGLVQAIAPAVVRRSADGLSREVPEARLWSVLLVAIPLALALALQLADLPRPDLVVATGLALFGFAFAVNSSLHSYLILAYAGSEKAAEDVGFYYAANAVGASSARCCRACSTSGAA